jgi:hypothetical protein
MASSWVGNTPSADRASHFYSRSRPPVTGGREHIILCDSRSTGQRRGHKIIDARGRCAVGGRKRLTAWIAPYILFAASVSSGRFRCGIIYSMFHDPPPPWWITLLLDTLLGAMVPSGLLRTSLLWIRRLFQRDNFIGTWYYYSGGYVAYSFFPIDATAPRYKAPITKEGGRLIEAFITMDHRASGYCSFPEPYGNSDRLYGFWTSVNFGDAHKMLANGLIVFSRTRIDMDRIEDEMEAGFEFHGNIPSMMRLRASHSAIASRRIIKGRRRRLQPKDITTEEK